MSQKAQVFQPRASEVRLGNIYESNGKVWMQNSNFKVGFNPAWGGTISDLIINGENIVNTNNGPGRGIQAAIFDSNQKYDNCAGCTGVFGWNPTQGGDIYGHGSLVLSKSISTNTVYFKTAALEWFPDDKGGGKTKPVVSDTTLEQWTSFVPGHPDAIKIHYKITHNGQDSHANNGQEIPVVTLTNDINQIYYYSGNNPWQNEPLTSQVLTPGTNSVSSYGPFYAPEVWFNVTNGKNAVAFYTPGQQPYFGASSFPGAGGPTGVGTNVFSAVTYFAFAPGRILESDSFIVVGPAEVARRTITAIKQESAHPFDPNYAIDSPKAQSKLTGNISVVGWVLDILPVQKVEVLVDDNSAGTALLGLSRLDVAKVWPNSNPNSGFNYSLNTSSYFDGQHSVSLKITTSDNKTIVSSPITVAFSNGRAVPAVDVYRLVAKNGDHFYTNSQSEVKQAQQGGYTLEGAVFKAYSTKTTGTQEIYRMYNSAIGDHFYTYSQPEIDYAVKSGWKLDGVAFYASSTVQSNLVPVYRLVNSKSQHFYTASSTEKDQAITAGFKLEGKAFYVPGS